MPISIERASLGPSYAWWADCDRATFKQRQAEELPRMKLTPSTGLVFDGQSHRGAMSSMKKVTKFQGAE